ncbi:Alpha/beta hydrolase fold-3 [Macleaya cordata]|uniref:Alpha/beta hydrolase fold-3 n=1 Tax=Macleaya cordata TaxID=56857 RepID=A0A200QAH5_MACCD|nr:Alpha/beta hydrolase fold-3 [Macleaya cordata]
MATKSTSPDLPSKTRIMFAYQTAVTDASRRSNGTVNRRFLNIFNFFLKISPNEKPIQGVKTLDITVDQSKNLFFRLFIPTKTPSDVTLPVIIYFHGGGFSFLSPDFFIYDRFCRRFARKIPAIVVSVSYRLSPEYRFPTQYEDGLQSLRFLDGNNFQAFPANADLSKCFLAGDSAGGNLAHHVAVRFAETEFRQVRVIGLIAIQPFFGGEERTESEKRLVNVPVVSIKRTDWQWKAFLPEGADRDHEAVNVFGPKSADISGLTKFPATLVVTGGFDPLQDWQKRYYEGLKRFGKEAYLVEYPRAIHLFYGFPELPESSMLINEMKNFIEKLQATKKC